MTQAADAPDGHATVGKGKYDDVSKMLQELLQAEGVLVLVVNGKLGSGASVTGSAESRLMMATAAELLAPQLRNEAQTLEATVRRQQGKLS